MEKREPLAVTDLKIGLLTLLALAILIAGIVFAGGDKGLLFAKRSLIKSHLYNVGGLKIGSSVTMAGMTIGRVTDIQFGPNNKDKFIAVTMEVRADVRNRIKADTIPSVRTMGMMGDRYLDLSIADEASPTLPEGQVLEGNETGDFDSAIQKAGSVLTETDKLLIAINEQQGTAGKFVYSNEFHEELLRIAKDVQELLQDFKQNPRRYLKFSVF